MSVIEKRGNLPNKFIYLEKGLNINIRNMAHDANYSEQSMALTNENVLNRHSGDKSIKTILQEKICRLFSLKTVRKILPCLTWLPTYSCNNLTGDFVAGLTVGLLIIPQALAYGLVAGLSPNYGLYSAFMGCIVYFFLGSTRELSIGPTAIMSLMTLHYTSQGGADYAVFLCFTTGIIEVLAGIINLGFLINFISQPVISGFTSAAAITIASSQLKGLFGLELKTTSVIDTWYKVCVNIAQTRWQDAVLGLSCILALSIMKEMRSFKCKCAEHYGPRCEKWSKKMIFLLSIARNALIVLIAALIAFSLEGDNQPFTLTGDVQAGIPTPRVPPFSTTVNNVTMGTFDMLEDIGIGIAMVPFIAILDDIAVVSAISKGRPFDASQEIIALGAINVLGAFFSSLPTTASLSRTAINLSSGVNTPTGGLVTGTIVLLALQFLTPFFKFIPKATLSAVIICAVLHMFDYEILKPMWRTKKADVIPLLVTFLACLFIGLEWGILLGIALNLLMMLFTIAKPPVHVTFITIPKTNIPAVLVTPTIGIFFPSTLHVRSAILKAGMKQGEGKLPVIVNCNFLVTMDYTSSKGLVGTIEDFERREQPIVFVKLQPQVYQVIKALKDIVTYESLEDLHHFQNEKAPSNDACSTAVPISNNEAPQPTP